MGIPGRGESMGEDQKGLMQREDGAALQAELRGWSQGVRGRGGPEDARHYLKA